MHSYQGVVSQAYINYVKNNNVKQNLPKIKTKSLLEGMHYFVAMHTDIGWLAILCCINAIHVQFANIAKISTCTQGMSILVSLKRYVVMY